MCKKVSGKPTLANSAELNLWLVWRNFLHNKKGLLTYVLLLLLLIILGGCGCNIETVEEHNSKIEKDALERSSALESLLNRTETDETSTTVPDFEVSVSDAQSSATVNENTNEASDNQTVTDNQNTADTKNETENRNTAENNGASIPINVSVSSEAASVNGTSPDSGETTAKDTIPEESQSTKGQTVDSQTTAPYIMVHITITCSKVIDNPDLSTDAGLPENGIILDTYVAVKDGDSVFTALKAAADDNGISLSYTGSKGSVYVTGINELYEKQCGRYSGWKYSVNNVYPNVGCGGYALSDGDSILFGYTATYTDTY